MEDVQHVPLAAAFHAPPATEPKGWGPCFVPSLCDLDMGGGSQPSSKGPRPCLGCLVREHHSPPILLCEFSPETVGCSGARAWPVRPCFSRAWHMAGPQCRVARWMLEAMASSHLRL